MFEVNRQAATFDRALRVLRCSKHSALIKHVVDNLEVSVKIEAKNNDTFDFQNIKNIINTAFLASNFSSTDVRERADALFVVLSEMYNDNKISVHVIGSDGCGYTTSYYNNLPQQLIKI